MAIQSQIPDFFSDFDLEENKVKPISNSNTRETKQNNVSNEIPIFFLKFMPEKQPLQAENSPENSHFNLKCPLQNSHLKPDFFAEIEGVGESKPEKSLSKSFGYFIDQRKRLPNKLRKCQFESVLGLCSRAAKSTSITIRNRNYQGCAISSFLRLF